MKIMQFGWKPTVDCIIDLRGLNLDKVWENIVVDIGGVNILGGVIPFMSRLLLMNDGKNSKKKLRVLKRWHETKSNQKGNLSWCR